MKITHLAVLLAGAVTLVGCAQGPQTKYDWGNYTPTMLALDQDPTTAPDFEKNLAAMVNGDPKRVPPGIFAEYGYVLLKKGDKQGAAHWFEAEKRAWPESTVLMDKMLGATGAQTASAANNKPAS